MQEPTELLCTDCVYYPEPRPDVETSAPDRLPTGDVSKVFYCSRIRQRVSPTDASHCPEFEEAGLDEREDR